ncbi:uncharacterized protein LOC106478683 [Limulus polyphemus]|uniref:Uncharacterized protein LOC106478683 n=1 Tax=Limulus polyphemus TaxID=6850 RepID=A0ABM1C5R0_LIMPO|nr:uncharacterized protein LOC106478683 [Limulus polyphemus]XP_022238041.1 uncharacterized protein LOC106478683 [Limulus polyphemus]
MEVSDHVSNVQHTYCENDSFVELCSKNRTFSVPDTNSPDNIIYSEALHQPSTKEKVAVQKLTEKYDTLGRINVEETDKTINCGSVDVEDIQQDLEDESQCNSNNLYSELTEQDIAQVETFFRSHKTFVFVCQCLANLYLRKAEGEWELAQTGVPVLLFDKGETRARNKRRLKLVLAEKGTGFILWHDVIDNLTNYQAQDNSFHTLFLSTDHSQMGGFSFENKTAARQFHEQVDLLTSDPLNISLSVPKAKGKNAKKKLEKIKLPQKCDISLPCCFEHVTSIDIRDKEQFYTLANLVQGKSKKVFEQFVHE